MKKILAGLAAFAVAFVGAGTTAQTQSPPGQKATKPDDTKIAAQTAVGTVKTTLPDSIVVTGKVKGQDVEWTFGVDTTTTKVRKASKDVTAAELRPGDPVRVRYLERDGKTIAQHIAVTTTVKPKAETAPAQKK